MPSAWTLDSLPNYYPARFLALLCPSQGRKMTVFAFEFKILKATHKAPNCKYMIDYDFIKFPTYISHERKIGNLELWETLGGHNHCSPVYGYLQCQVQSACQQTRIVFQSHFKREPHSTSATKGWEATPRDMVFTNNFLFLCLLRDS